MTLKDFQGVVFDLDGTLLDTLTDIANATNAVLSAHHLPTHPPPAYRAFVGEGVRVLLTRALPVGHRDEATLEACLRTMQIEYPRHLNETARPYPGVPELLTGLKNLGKRMAVLSNKPDEYAGRCVTDFFGKDLFNVILGLRDDRPRKPDPTGALEIAARWGVSASQILFVGDSGTDVQTALRAGMTPVGALWGYQSESELLTAGARYLLNAPTDLLAWQEANPR